MVRFNFHGLVMLLVAGCAGLASSWLVVENWLLVTAVLLVVLDVIYRSRTIHQGWDKWLAGYTGGFLGISPVWITGLLLLVLHFTGWLDLAVR